jgi:hypothetical protein
MSLGWLSTAALLAEVDQASLWTGIFFTTAAVMAGSYGIVHAVIRHRERMAKIGMGIDPDAPTSSAGQPKDPASQYSR